MKKSNWWDLVDLIIPIALVFILVWVLLEAWCG
jgi:hypothetical protein